MNPEVGIWYTYRGGHGDRVLWTGSGVLYKAQNDEDDDNASVAICFLHGHVFTVDAGKRADDLRSE